ncbi:hypothetical protein [Nocardia sp. NPDC005998]|uniref:McrC family protein n=1 Tax=Nocardia sp. NPDC005998 TaxID=3156894 RepID=UPI0033A805BA
MIPIDLDENETKSVALDQDQADAITASKIVDITPDRDNHGHWLLKPSGKAGTALVRTATGADVLLRIAPKIPVARLLFLVGYVLNPRGWRDEEVPVGTESDLVPVMAVLFQRYASIVLRRGPVSDYRAVERTDVILRGRLRAAEQLHRHQNRMVPAEISADERTFDLLENRLLRTACDRLLSFSAVLPDKVTADLRRIGRELRRVNVLPVPVHRPVPAWRPAPRNAGYREALKLAGFVLRDLSVERATTPRDPIMVHGFIFQMSTVFQDFVTVALREAIRERGGRCEIAPMGKHFLADRERAELKPDLVAYAGNRPILIVDAKYKVDKLPKADVYQMLAYCVGLGLDEGHIVHPAGARSSGDYTIPRANIRVRYHAIDLNQPREALLADIDALSRRLLPTIPRGTA